jgi:hypothetical protein
MKEKINYEENQKELNKLIFAFISITAGTAGALLMSQLLSIFMR